MNNIFQATSTTLSPIEFPPKFFKALIIYIAGIFTTDNCKDFWHSAKALFHLSPIYPTHDNVLPTVRQIALICRKLVYKASFDIFG